MPPALTPPREGDAAVPWGHGGPLHSPCGGCTRCEISPMWGVGWFHWSCSCLGLFLAAAVENQLPPL